MLTLDVGADSFLAYGLIGLTAPSRQVVWSVRRLAFSKRSENFSPALLRVVISFAFKYATALLTI